MRARRGVRGIVSFTLLSSSLVFLAGNASAQDEEAKPAAGTEEETATPPPKPHKKAAPEEAPAEEVAPPPPEAKVPPPSGIQIANSNGWKISVDGRINAFFVYGFGNHNASTAPETGANITPGIGTGITADNQIDVNGNFKTPRIRSGFVPNILGFNFSKQISD